MSSFGTTWSPPPRKRDLPPPPQPLELPEPRGTYTGSTTAPVPKPEVKAKPGKRTPTKDEREWMDKIVRYGCVACRMDGNGIVPPAVHHILRGGRRIGHLFTLPLCDPGHHKDGLQMDVTSRHPWKKQFEAKYGTEMELLARLRAEIGTHEALWP